MSILRFDDHQLWDRVDDDYVDGRSQSLRSDALLHLEFQPPLDYFDLNMKSHDDLLEFRILFQKEKLLRCEVEDAAIGFDDDDVLSGFDDDNPADKKFN